MPTLSRFVVYEHCTSNKQHQTIKESAEHITFTDIHYRTLFPRDNQIND